MQEIVYYVINPATKANNKNKNISKDTQEMPQSGSTAFQRHKTQEI